MRRLSPGGWPRPGARPVDLLQDGWEACTVDEVRARHEAETRRTRPSPGGRAACVDRKKASRSFLGAPSLTTKKTRTTPIEGNQDAEQTRPHDGSPGARDRREKEDRSRPGQHQAPPRQGPDRPIRPRSGPGAHHTHLHAPLRPRPWVPPSTHATPPEPAPPTPARSPRRTPSRPSPPTSPTAPSTTTSSTSQSHRPTPILFNSSHTTHWCRRSTTILTRPRSVAAEILYKEGAPLLGGHRSGPPAILAQPFC